MRLEPMTRVAGGDGCSSFFSSLHQFITDWPLNMPACFFFGCCFHFYHAWGLDMVNRHGLDDDGGRIFWRTWPLGTARWIETAAILSELNERHAGLLAIARPESRKGCEGRWAAAKGKKQDWKQGKSRRHFEIRQNFMDDFILLWLFWLTKNSATFREPNLSPQISSTFETSRPFRPFSRRQRPTCLFWTSLPWPATHCNSCNGKALR